MKAALIAIALCFAASVTLAAESSTQTTTCSRENGIRVCKSASETPTSTTSTTCRYGRNGSECSTESEDKQPKVYLNEFAPYIPEEEARKIRGRKWHQDERRLRQDAREYPIR